MTVEELLNSKQIPFIVKGNDYVVHCLNPEHPDRNPSMRIDRIDGSSIAFLANSKVTSLLTLVRSQRGYKSKETLL